MKSRAGLDLIAVQQRHLYMAPTQTVMVIPSWKNPPWSFLHSLLYLPCVCGFLSTKQNKTKAFLQWSHSLKTIRKMHTKVITPWTVIEKFSVYFYEGWFQEHFWYHISIIIISITTLIVLEDKLGWEGMLKKTVKTPPHKLENNWLQLCPRQI